MGISFRAGHTHSSSSCFIHIGAEIILAFKTINFKTMTIIEEAELDRLRQRQIKDYNPALNSFTKFQEQSFKMFKEPELSVETKWKIVAQLVQRYGFLLNKFKRAGQLLHRFCHRSLH